MLNTPIQAAQWLQQHVSGAVCTDSRRVQPGDAFIAWPGAATDGRAFVPAALQAGAAVCLVEAQGQEAFALDFERVASYRGLKAATGLIADEYFAHPSSQLAVLAVTGTNGKTSTAWWLAQALSALPAPYAMPCGLIGTLGIGRPGAVIPTGLTTPDPVQLQHALRTFVRDGLTACAIEASSIGIDEQRLAGTRIRLGLFTNFTQDHLDYHGSMQAYWAAKCRLFSWQGMQSAVINIDDAYGSELAQSLATRSLDVWTVSMHQPARLVARGLQYLPDGMAFDVVEGDAVQPLRLPLMGDYNVSNILGVLASLRALQVPLVTAVQVCGDLRPVPGRMECQGGVQAPLVAVDYAHTPDALDHALNALRPLVQQRGGKLWCVFGCGGDRDSSKRPLMGAIAAKRADHVVVTSDNPRSEKPETIVAQILLGLAPSNMVEVQVDRALAIAETLAKVSVNDVVLVAGKGHEETQEIMGQKWPFSDRALVAQALDLRRKHPEVKP
jgi:UDP-N-acetylmuramoyl-L-alanyl-D-glutamate--2,6-diaminopimelate ligase